MQSDKVKNRDEFQRYENPEESKNDYMGLRGCCRGLVRKCLRPEPSVVL